MRLFLEKPLSIRGLEFGGHRSLFCVPLVSENSADLLSQAQVAHAAEPDLIEWRADYYKNLDSLVLVDSAKQLRSVIKSEAVIFTLRIKAEGGAQEISQQNRRLIIEAAIGCGLLDVVDVELCNGPEFIESVLRAAREHRVPVILSYHDFHATPSNDMLLEIIAAMNRHGADIAKVAVMPQTADDVLRLLQVTLEARKTFPRLPLVTMSMGRLGAITRVAGFLYGSDMAFAVGQQASAPGQIPIRDARSITEMLLQYC